MLALAAALPISGEGVQMKPTMRGNPHQTPITIFSSTTLRPRGRTSAKLTEIHLLPLLSAPRSTNVSPSYRRRTASHKSCAPANVSALMRSATTRYPRARARGACPSRSARRRNPLLTAAAGAPRHRAIQQQRSSRKAHRRLTVFKPPQAAHHNATAPLRP